MKTEVLKNFIVLEGLDGSGTTTQLKKVNEALINDGKTVFRTFEPTDGPIGKLIRSVLQHKFTMTPKTVSKLYATDREEHIYGKEGILEQLNNNNVVLCDRYLFSSLAYQSPECGFDFVININSDYPLPEHLFFISVPVEICQQRIELRGDAKELFDAKEYQERVNSDYKKALDYYKDTAIKIHIIDGTKTPENITNEIMGLIRQ